MASDPKLPSPSSSSFLTAPSFIGVNSSPPAEPDSPSSLTGGANAIVAIDSASERWTCSDYSDFTALSAVSSTTPSILSVNSSMPGTNVPTAPHSPVREAVNDDADTNSASVDTIFGGPSAYDTARTNRYSLLRFISARPAPSESGSGLYSSFDFPTLNQAADVATEPEQHSSSFTQQHPMPLSQSISPTQPSPVVATIPSPTAVSTNLHEESRQPSPVPSESVDGLAEDLMAFSVSSSSNELPERLPPRTVHGASSSTTTSTLRPSPLPPNAPPSAAPLTMNWPMTASPEPVSEPDSQPAVDQGNGGNHAGASIPDNATTASGGFSHTTAERWPFMGSMDHLMHVPGPHYLHTYEYHPPSSGAQVNAQHPAHEPMSIFGQLDAGGPSTAISPERNDLGQQPPAYDLLTPSPPLNWLPTVQAGNGARTPSCDDTQLPPANDNFSWASSWPKPAGSEPNQQRSTVFMPMGSADATALTPENIARGQHDMNLDFEREFGAFFFGDAHPRLPYRVPSPHPITPTMATPPASNLRRPASFECNLFSGPPSTDASDSSFDCSTDRTEEYSNYTYAFARGAGINQDFRASNGVQSVDKGKGRVAVNTEEAKRAYERAVQARRNHQPAYVLSDEHRAFDVTKAQKAYEDAVQARDRLVQRAFGQPTVTGSGTGAPRALVATPDTSEEGDSARYVRPPSSGCQQSRDIGNQTHITASEVQSIQIVPGPGHTTVVVDQKASAQDPARSLEPVSVVSAPAWTYAEHSFVHMRSMTGAGEEEKGEGWKANELLNSVKTSEGAFQGDPQRHDARQRESRDAHDAHHTNVTDQRTPPTPMHEVPRPPRSRPSIESLPFIPPSRTSTASSMYTGPPAPSLHCQHPPPSPSSRSSSPDTPVVQPRRRSRSFRRTTSTHHNSAPAVSFVLPQATATDQTGPSYSAAQDRIPSWLCDSPASVTMAHHGMSSGKLSTLNFNDSTRPPSWSIPPTTFSTMNSAAPSVSGLNHFGTPAVNPPAHDSQPWPFGTSQAAATPAQGPGSWATWGNTPGQQQTPAWQQPASNWPVWGMTPGCPGQSPNFWTLQPQAPIMGNAMLPPSTSGTLGRNTALPHTQSTTLPTYPLPNGQYSAMPGVHSQFMPPLMSLPPHDPWGTRSAPPPYNGSPSGWGNVPPGSGGNMQSQPTGVNAWGSMARYPLHPKYNFPDGNVSFLVRGIEYRVHRYFFEKHSNQMKEMLASMPSSIPNIVPLTVDGVDFEKLLAVFYPSNPLESDLKDADDMGRAIRACQQLGFQDIRKSVIDLAMKLSPAERILLAREHCSIKELAISGYAEMCASGEPVSPEDGEKLGAATIIKVWEVQQLLAAQDFCREGCRKEFLESTVKEKFSLE